MTGLAAHATPTQLGDLDDDGVFTANDLAKLVAHSTGAAPLPALLQPFADLTQDSVINDADHAALVSLILESSTPQNLPPTTVREASPATGEGDVAVTRETVLHFTMPLALNTALDTTQFYAEFGGRKILSRVEVSSDKKKATLFYLEPLPSNARIQVSFDSTGVSDLLDRAMDGNADGIPGGIYRTSFDTLSITAVAGTAISGRVFASEPGRGAGGATVDVPLSGVTVTVDGAEETLRTTTDAQGNFTLNPAPAGSFFVHVDGRTSPQSSYPDGNYYPAVGKRWETLAGRTDNLSGNSQDTSRGIIYLPKVLGSGMAAASQSQDTEVAFPPSVVADNPALAGTELKVPANSLFADDGTRGGRIGIAPVAADRLPSPLPPGLELPMVITIQTDGATNFDRPVPVTFPNLPDAVTGVKLPPGAKSALWSFNHDLGDWEVVGPMTVTEDGNFVKTDAGVGVQQPGWHGTRPGSQGNSPPPLGPPKPPNPPCPDKSAWEWANLVFDVGKETATCTAGFFKIKDAINCGLSVVSTTKTLITSVMSLEDSLKKGSSLESAEIALGIIETEVSRVEGLLACYKATSPVQKGKAIVDCVVNALTSADTICQFVDDPSGPPACRQGRGTRTFCTGVLAARAAYDNVKYWVTFAEGVEEKFAVETLKLVVGKLRLTLELIRRSKNQISSSAFGPPPPPLSQGIPLTNNEARIILEDLKLLRDALNELSEGAAAVKNMSDEAANLEKKGDALFQQTAEDLRSIGSPIEGSMFFQFKSDSMTQRGKTGSTGSANFFMPADARYELAVYEPSTRQIATTIGATGDAGSRNILNALVLMSTAGMPDMDNDDLVDAAEGVIGTNPANPDTDGDGVTDGAEVQQGTNPLNGFIATTGIVASVPTTAPAADIHALDNVAVTANGAGGISVFNVLSGLNPTRIADVDTPGLAVAVAGNGDHVAVADYLSGLAIVDITNSAAVKLSAQVNVGAAVQAVAVNGGLALAGTTTGQIVTVDLATATVLGRVNLPVTSVIQDLTVWRDTLYALQVGKLTALDLNTLAIQGSLNLSGQMGAGQRRWRLFAGEGTLYATHTTGFNIVDTGTNPGAPTLVQNFTTSQFGWKQIVANGSGLGIAATSPNSTNDGPHEIDLYTLGTNQRTPAYGSTFETPGLAAAVSIYNGLAYVADNSSGLQVLSYLSYDSQGQAPTISLQSNFSLNTTTKTGTAEEGKLMRLSAQVTDDVQVRNVEFHVDGQLLITDGNYPFEHRFRTPAISSGSPSFKVKAKATDTGGNVAWTDEYTITLVPDATPPQVLTVSPGNNAITGALTSLHASFNEPMNPATFATGFRLTEAGADKAHGTADDVVRSGDVTYRENIRTAFMAFPSPGLQPGLYRISLQAPAADGAGNVIATPFVSGFRIYNASLDTDGDGVPDEYEPALGLNPTKADTNNNGISDGMEDYDGDGLKNAAELAYGFNPLLSDGNGNGIADGLEDPDYDALTNSQELAIGSHPLNPDTDADGWNDETEVTGQGNPLNPAIKPRLMISSAPQAAINIHKASFEAALGYGVITQQPQAPINVHKASFEAALGYGVITQQPQAPINVHKASFGTGQGYGALTSQPQAPVKVRLQP
jgi:hypothetical protein